MFISQYKYKILTLITILFLLFALYVVGSNAEIKLAIQLYDLEFQEIYDSYDGIPYEGEKLSVANSNSLNPSVFEDWNELPLTAEISSFLYEEDSDGLTRAAKIGFPDIQDGRWFFLDKGNTDFTNPISVYNFSLYIYDSVNNNIYLYEFDM